MDEYIYNIIDKESLTDMLQAFHAASGICTYLMSRNGEIIMQFGPTYPYCTFVYSHLSESICHKVRVDAGKRAMETGTSYIFSCHANLTHISFPLMSNGEFFGSIQVGPFLMEAPNSSLVMDIGERYSEFKMSDLMILYDDASDLPQITPDKVTQLSKLLYYLMSSVITDSKDKFIINQKKMTQQGKINESIQRYKTTEKPEEKPYPMDLEQQMLTEMTEGNLPTARDRLNELLAFLYYQNGNNISAVRFRAIEIGSVMVHRCIEACADSVSAFNLSDHFMHDVSFVGSIDELSISMDNLLEGLIDCFYSFAKDPVMQNIIKYIQSNYSRQISLINVAEHAHLNPSYLSRIFKQSVGISFREYLTKVRLDEAKRLLLNTSYGIIDIALAVGFEDASYFSQVFKKEVGVSPIKFRKQFM